MARQKPIASEKMQTPEEIAAKRIHQQNAQRRQHQRRLQQNQDFIEGLAKFVECSPGEIPRYAKTHGIPLYQG
ncbi:MAG: hypothetical protein QMC36_01745 [Patescibacteria group bacterium]